MHKYPRFDVKTRALALGAALVAGSVAADFPAQLELSTLNGSNGVVYTGVTAADHSGRSVAGAGDLNGDSIDDLVIGAPDADPNDPFSGAVYVVFGKAGGFTSPFDLSALNGSNGFVIHGEAQFDGAGFSVSAAGDVNGDGFDDLVIGAPDASPVQNFSGAAYVVFGTDQGFAHPFELSALNGNNGFRINGVGQDDSFGTSVSGAGDINGDTFHDLVVGAPFADPGGESGAGSSYVIFGTDQAFPNPLDAASLDGSNGFIVNGILAADSSGSSVSAAGDVNADGIGDLVIGAPLAGPPGANPGYAYVVFGNNGAWGASFSLADLDGNNGFAISGVATSDGLGGAVAKAGDLNADGVADLVLGAAEADPNGMSSGAAYVLFGSNQPWAASVALSTLNGTTGFAIHGASVGDEAGAAVGAAGQVDMDAFDDLLIGAPKADPNGSSSGRGYVLYGSDQAWTSPVELSALDGTDGFLLNGATVEDRAGTSVGAAGDINNDGRADFLLGAPGDPLGNSPGRSYLVLGDTGAGGDLIFADSFE